MSESLATFVPRRTLLRAVQHRAAQFHGVLLDIGCGAMPYRDLLTAPPSRVVRYVGLDLPDRPEHAADLRWDGRSMPIQSHVIDCVLATEVLEHCADPEALLREAVRVLKPGGFLFFTVPFVWPLHEAPHDQYRYTPWSLQRHFLRAGFARVECDALGGWNASLAQVLGLWLGRGPGRRWAGPLVRALGSLVVRALSWADTPPREFDEGTMITGFCGVAVSPKRAGEGA